MSNSEIHKLLLYATGALTVLAAVVALAATVFSKRADADKVQRSAMAGVLTPAPPTKIPLGRFPYPEIEIGDSGSIFVVGGPTGEFLRFGDNSLAVALDPKGQVLVSLGIRDRAGALVAELTKNEWTVNPGRTWDRNYTADALEVKDASGSVVLQVRLKGHRVQLQTRLYDEHGNGFGIVKAPRLDGREVGGMFEMTGTKHPEFTHKIEPIFLYPSSQHFGELR